MSIQDESFPCDYDLNFSHNSGENFVFSHHKPRRNNVLENKGTNDDHEDLSKNNTSITSPLQNEDDSTQSSTDFCLPSETSSKTNASEPNDLQESDNKKSSGFIRHNPNKAVSYQDIHSEYTKRRYKHVESKVGQYIANMKAQDEKRRNSGKFQRYSSLPETLHGRETPVVELENESKKHGLLHCSTNDLDHLHNRQNELQSEHDGDNYDNLTSTISSLSTRDLASENGIFLDKQTYEQLLSDKERKDYLQAKLEEKNAENWRLKQNLDTIRVEYSICKDKLKQQTQAQAQRFTGSFGNINTVSILGRTTLQSILYPQETLEKYTQTDKALTPSPIQPESKPGNDIYVTPFNPDSNNNAFDRAAVGVLAPAAHKVFKNVATIQPISLNFSNLVDQDLSNSNINTTIGFLRQRSNSLTNRKKSTPLPGNISKISSTVSSVPSSSDSAIDIEVIESPQSQHEEFTYYGQQPQRYAVVESRNDSQNNTDFENSTLEGGMSRSNKRKCRKRRNLRSRMMRIFGACARCKDPNNSLEVAEGFNHSQIPLLEKSTSNYCPNVR